MSNTFYFVETGEEIRGFPDFSQKFEPEYPSAWFKVNKDLPSITVYKTTPGQSYDIVQKCNENEEWDDIAVCTFMSHVITENPQMFQIESVEEDWNSYGKKLAAKGKSLTPLNLLTLRYIDLDEKYKTIPESTSSNSSRKSLFFAILCLYRKVGAFENGANNAAATKNKLNSFFMSAEYGMTSADADFCARFKYNFQLTPGYKKILCVIDMFMVKFDKHPYASIRTATLATRYKGCSTLTSLEELAKHLDIEPDELLLFLDSDKLEEEAAHICRKNEESEDVYGYFPYQLELTTRSAYSVSMNQNLYLWLHVIGCITKFPRSYHARMPKEPFGIYITVNSAAITALVLSRKTQEASKVESDYVCASHSKAEVGLDQPDSARAAQSSRSTPLQRRDAFIADRMYLENQRPEEETLRELKDRVSHLKDCRQNTIGSIVYSKFRVY